MDGNKGQGGPPLIAHADVQPASGDCLLPHLSAERSGQRNLLGLAKGPSGVEPGTRQPRPTLTQYPNTLIHTLLIHS